MEIIFAQLIVSPAATEQRQIDVALSLMNAKQGSSNFRILEWRGRGSSPRPPSLSDMRRALQVF